VVASFITQWRRGARPSVDLFLGNSSGSHRTRLLVALINADLPERIAFDRSFELERYIEQFPELGSARDLPLELILTEYNARLANGDQPELSTYARRFPEQIAALRAHLNVDPASDRVVPEVSQLLEPGATVGDFQIVRLLGQGATACVYLAKQLQLDRQVALKVSPARERDLCDEARTLALLDHDHIVPVYVEQIVGDRRLMAMRYVPGVTVAWLLGQLEERSRTRCSGIDLLKMIDSQFPGEVEPQESSVRVPLRRFDFVRSVCHIVAGLARGLEHAHQRRVLHCDIKPANILIAQTGRAMLMDFNIASRFCSAQAVTSAKDEGGEVPASAANATAVVGGTPEYMSPEQLAAMAAQGGAGSTVIDERSDVYSLGVVLYELLSGSSPFPSPSTKTPLQAVVGQSISARMRGPLPIPSVVVRISPGLDSILEKCLAPDPADRYRTAGEFAEDLDRYVNQLPLRHAPDPSWRERTHKWLRRHPRWVAVAITALVAVVIALVAEICLENSYLRKSEALVVKGYRQMGNRDLVGAYESLKQAEQLVAKSDRLMPLIGLRHRITMANMNLRRLASFIPAIPYRSFQTYAGLARGRHSMHQPDQGNRIDPPAIQALSVYQVLDDPDWQQLPQFQELDSETRSEVEAFVTEMIVIRAVDLIALRASYDTTSIDATRLNEFIGRVPSVHKGRYVIVVLEKLVADNSEPADTDAASKLSDTFDFYLMGVLMARLGRYESARSYFDSVLRRAGKDETGIRFWAHFYRAYCAEQTEAVDLAIADYAACIGIDNQFLAHHNLGLLYLRQEKFDLAARYLRDAVRHGGGSVVSIQVNLAAAELKLGNLPQALDAANDALRLDDQCADAYANRGATHAAMGHLDLAIADLERALKLDPNCEAARQNLEVITDPK
jgi:serine/threonine protein kinase/Tfp pilus assembly protein PilF